MLESLKESLKRSLLMKTWEKQRVYYCHGIFPSVDL
jgi:hypothetical protein